MVVVEEAGLEDVGGGGGQVWLEAFTKVQWASTLVFDFVVV